MNTPEGPKARALDIVPLHEADAAQTADLFRSAIGGVFERNGILDSKGLAREIDEKLDLLRRFLEGNMEPATLVVAKEDGQVLGTAAIAGANASIREFLHVDLGDSLELAAVYVRPDRQGQGIATALVRHMLLGMQARGVRSLCLDCGYPSSQGYWRSLFGEPTVSLDNHWGNGHKYMIWHVPLGMARARLDEAHGECSNIRLILFDVDGVIIRLPRYFSGSLEARGYRGANGIINGYYASPEDKRCLMGEEDPTKAILPWLESLGWEHGVEEYFAQQYRFERDWVDQDLLDRIQGLRKAGVACWLATDQDSHRRRFLLEGLGFASSFDGHLVSSLVGAQKVQAEFWERALSRLRERMPGLETSSILFIDDNAANLTRAAARGIATFHVAGEDSIVGLKELLDRVRQTHA
jgi:putative hydrolase of the HAD superfamily